MSRPSAKTMSKNAAKKIPKIHEIDINDITISEPKKRVNANKAQYNQWDAKIGNAPITFELGIHKTKFKRSIYEEPSTKQKKIMDSLQVDFVMEDEEHAKQVDVIQGIMDKVLEEIFLNHYDCIPEVLRTSSLNDSGKPSLSRFLRLQKPMLVYPLDEKKERRECDPKMYFKIWDISSKFPQTVWVKNEAGKFVAKPYTVLLNKED